MTTPLIVQQTMPGSRGEHDLQERYGNRKRAEGFYKNQMLTYLNPQMRTFIDRQEMLFLYTAELPRLEGVFAKSNSRLYAQFARFFRRGTGHLVSVPI